MRWPGWRARPASVGWPTSWRRCRAWVPPVGVADDARYPRRRRLTPSRTRARAGGAVVRDGSPPARGGAALARGREWARPRRSRRTRRRDPNPDRSWPDATLLPFTSPFSLLGKLVFHAQRRETRTGSPSPRSEQGGADADHRRTLLHGHLQVARHPHRALRQGELVGQRPHPAEARPPTVSRLRRPDGHEPVDTKPQVAQALDEPGDESGGSAAPGRVVRQVDLDEHRRTGRPLRD